MLYFPYHDLKEYEGVLSMVYLKEYLLWVVVWYSTHTLHKYALKLPYTMVQKCWYDLCNAYVSYELVLCIDGKVEG